MPGPARHAIVDRVARLTREQIAPRAAEYDAAGANPVESWRVLAREGLLGACIPVARGGLGLDMPTYVGVIRAIQVVGGRGAYKDFPAERAFRDLRTSTLMPPTVDRMLEGIGKNALGIEAGMFKLPE